MIVARRVHGAGLAALLACLVATSGAVAAALPEGLAMGWNDCRPPGGSGSADVGTFLCGSNTSTFHLYPTYRPAIAIDSVFTVELVIDVDVASDSLPPWWVMNGTCRPLAWTATATGSASCADLWNGFGAGSVQGWLPGTPGGSRRHARLLVAAGVTSDHFVKLEAGVPYVLCDVGLDSRGTSACPNGCTTPACLVFNSALIRTLNGDLPLVSTPESPGANWATWQSNAGTADCLSVPTRRRTWGAVKALYR